MANRDPDSFADRISELEEWRRDVAPLLSALRTELDGIVNEQKIAAGVAEELRRRGIAPTAEAVANRTVDKIDEHGGFPRVPFTWYQKLGAFVAGAILLADSIRNLLS